MPCRIYKSSLQSLLLFFSLSLLSACSSYRSQIPENESELFKTIQHDQFDDGYTPIVDEIITPYYRLTQNNDMDCALRALRITSRNADQAFSEPISYYVLCNYTNKDSIELKQAQDHNGKALDIEYNHSKVFSDGKEVSSQITKQNMLIELNSESLVQSLTQRQGYTLVVKADDISKKNAYLTGVKIEIPARLLQGFFQYSKITWGN
jgi:hypothetical protein